MKNETYKPATIEMVAALMEEEKKSVRNLSNKEMVSIIKNKQISKCTKDERAQVMNFAFGAEYMSSTNKGAIVTI